MHSHLYFLSCNYSLNKIVLKEKKDMKFTIADIKSKNKKVSQILF